MKSLAETKKSLSICCLIINNVCYKLPSTHLDDLEKTNHTNGLTCSLLST